VGIAAGLALILSLHKPQHTPLRWPILIIIVMSTVSLLVTADSSSTTPQVTRLLAGIAGFLALVNWARTRQQLFLFSLLLLTAGALIAILAPVIVRWNQAKGIPIPNIIYETFPLLFSDSVHPNVMVSIMVMLLPLSFAYLLLSHKRGSWPLSTRWAQILLLLTLILMSIVLLLTKSRGGYVAGAIGILTVLWYSRWRILALTLTLLTTGLGLWLIAGADQQAPTLAGELANAGTLAFRQQVWRIASWMIADFPFTGVGMGTFNDVAVRLYPFSDVPDPGAHNLFLQVGVDLGIPGLIAFTSILLLALYMSFSSITYSTAQEDHALRALSVGLLAGITALLFHGLVEITVWGTRVSFLPWLIIGLVTAVHLHSKPMQ
jgi:putative inorganic carbon (HCO3(-)) transporter